MSAAARKGLLDLAEGKVHDLGYVATSPILLNIQGQPTYFMTLKDGEGLVKQYAFVSVKSYDQVGVGVTMDEANRNYIKVLDTGTSTVIPEEEQETVTGKVVRIAGEYDGSQVQYSFMIDSRPNIIFEAASELSAELPLTREGDEVSVTFAKADSGVVKAAAFDNLQFTQDAGQ